jgi:glycosyltransferase involved in cell wall biosynthesis
MSLKISIITVAYNAEKSIEDTIQSVIGQTYKNIEYIIIDGNSTDDTLKICNTYKESIHTIVSEKDKGIYDAMNKGIALATGDVIGVLNADDFYLNSNVISKVAERFNTDNCEGLYADLVYVDGDDTSKITRTWFSGNYIENSFFKGWMPPHPTFFVKQACYKKYGHYSLDLKSAADYELMLRMIHKHKIKLSYLHEVTVKMRVGGVSNSSLKNRIDANKEDREAWRMNDLKPGLFTLIRKPLSKVFQFLKK